MSRPQWTRMRRGQVGILVLILVIGVALLGPWFAPYAPADLVGSPGMPPGNGFVLGTDYLGHDVLSRVLWGGRSVLLLALSATLLGYLLGVTLGLVAGYSRSLLDPLIMRSVDVVLAFPPLLFFLIVATGVGTSQLVLVLVIAVVQAPAVARIVYTATRETSTRGYVEAAQARGERTTAVLSREVLPNILAAVIANVGLSLTFSILLVAAVNFLGLGLHPPAANWALMIAENRPVLTLNVWATIVPAALIAALTVGVNLVGDAVAQSLGRSEVAAEPVGTSAPAPLKTTELLS